VQTQKITTSGFRATDLHTLNTNHLEGFDFNAATEQHNPCAEALLSRKESAPQTASLCAFSSEVAGTSPLKSASYSTPSTSQFYRKYANRLYIA
jgi:hypothetical protein